MFNVFNSCAVDFVAYVCRCMLCGKAIKFLYTIKGIRIKTVLWPATRSMDRLDIDIIVIIILYNYYYPPKTLETVFWKHYTGKKYHICSNQITAFVSVTSCHSHRTLPHLTPRHLVLTITYSSILRHELHQKIGYWVSFILELERCHSWTLEVLGDFHLPWVGSPLLT